MDDGGGARYAPRVRARANPDDNGARQPSGREYAGPVGSDGMTVTPHPSEVHTEEEWETYFAAVAQGIGLDLAARSIGSTGTRIKRLVARAPEYALRLQEALADAGEHYRDRLRAAARLEALGTEGRPPNARILEVELATHGGPEYSHLRRDRVKHEGRIEHALILDATKLDALDEEELAALEPVFAKLAAEEQKALPPGPA